MEPSRRPSYSSRVKLGRYISGVAIALAAFLAIVWLDAPLWLVFGGYCLVVAALFTVLVAVRVLRNLSPRVSVTPRPDAVTPDELERIEAEVAKCGFRLVSPPLEVSIEPTMWIFLFSDGADTLAMLSRTTKGTDTFSLSSTFDLPDRPGLATVDNPLALSLPTTHRDLRQCFEGAALDDLAERHREALEIVRGRGIPVRPADPTEFESLFAQSLAETRERFLRFIPLSVFVFLWRVVRRRSPEVGPVDEHARGRRALRELAKVARGDAHAGRPRTF